MFEEVRALAIRNTIRPRRCEAVKRKFREEKVEKGKAVRPLDDTINLLLKRVPFTPFTPFTRIRICGRF
jgi:hypothetical protein